MKEPPFKSNLPLMEGNRSEAASHDNNRNEVINYREQFRDFLHKDRFSDYGAERYIDSLVSVVDFYIQILADPNHRTVLEITDVDLLTQYYSILMNDFTFVNQNRSKQKRPTAALLEYIEFARSLPSLQQQLATSEESPSLTKGSKPEIVKICNRTTTAQLLKQSQKQQIINQARVIIRPIEDYLQEYKLSSLIVFEYHGVIRDVDVKAPRFKRDITTEAQELTELVSLMKKYEVAIPLSIRQRHDIALEQKAMRDNIRAFENWIVGYMAYLPKTQLEVNSIYFSPDSGFRVCLSGTNVAPVVVKMQTSIVDDNVLDETNNRKLQ